jgi:hypothetical protein
MPKTTPRETRRVNVNFSPEVFATLDGIARERGKPLAAVLQDAVSLEAWLMREQQAGTRILIDRGGVQRELVLRPPNCPTPSPEAREMASTAKEQ